MENMRSFENIRSFLIHLKQFSRIDTRCANDAFGLNKQTIALITECIQALHRESDISPNTEIVVSQDLQNGSYDHDENIISLPYRQHFTGLDYYIMWRHEAEHAHQQAIRDSEPTEEQTLLNISRLLYPSNIYDSYGAPAPEYLYNYMELRARTAEAIALREALEERYNATPRDFWYKEKRAYLDTLKRFLENTALQHDIKQCRQYCNSQNIAILRTKDTNNELRGLSRLKALMFWNTTGRNSVMQAFREFQKAREALTPLRIRLEQDMRNISQDTLDELQTREEVGRQQHEQLHQAISSVTRVVQVADLEQPIPDGAIVVRGAHNMEHFLTEYREILPSLTICEEFDTSTFESLYVVFNSSPTPSTLQTPIHDIASPYEYPVEDVLDWLEKNISIDEIEDDELE